MNPATRAAVARALGAALVSVEGVSGGDISDAFRVTLAGGRRVFAKVNARAEPLLFEREARGLAWLAEARTLAVPAVLGVGTGEGAAPFLLLEWVEPGTRARDFDERLGRGLAALHRTGAPCFGLDHDNYIGLLQQHNAPTPTWAAFYRERRIAPLLELARVRGFADAALERLCERLFARLEELVGPAEAPARLHGDLWGGNLHVDAYGQPMLIDPAVYGGHREIDLAMMQLFGGFGARTWAAYEESYPLSAGYRDRIALYQVYPLFVHLCSFGTGYLTSLKRAISRYV